MSTESMPHDASPLEELVSAHDAERAAYARMRAAVPDLGKPASSRSRLTAGQRSLVRDWSRAEQLVHDLDEGGGRRGDATVSSVRVLRDALGE